MKVKSRKQKKQKIESRSRKDLVNWQSYRGINLDILNNKLNFFIKFMNGLEIGVLGFWVSKVNGGERIFGKF